MTNKEKIKIKYVSWEDMNEQQRIESQYYALKLKRIREKCKKRNE